MAAQDADSGDNETTLWKKLSENIRVMAEDAGATELEESDENDNQKTRLRKTVHNLYRMTQV